MALCGAKALWDLDVAVRGTADGKRQLALIECKDWKKKVGIDIVDALAARGRSTDS